MREREKMEKMKSGFNKRLVSLLIMLALVISMFSMCKFSVYAEGDTCTIKVADGDIHEYDIYQVFTGKLNGDELTSLRAGAQYKGDKTVAGIVDAAQKIAATSSLTDKEKLRVITQYVNFDTSYGVVSADSTQTVPTGYYLIRDRAITSNALVNGDTYTLYLAKVAKDITIQRKSSNLTFSSYEITENNNNKFGKYADCNIGDTLLYQLKGTFPDDLSNYATDYRFIITIETNTNVTASGFSVKLNGNQVTLTSQGTDNTIKATDNKVVIDLTKAVTDSLDSLAGKSFEVNYNAVVKDSAIVGKAGNISTASIQYSRNPNATSASENYINTTEELSNKFYLYQVAFEKEDAQGTKVNGAGFTLSKYKNSGYEVIGSEIKNDSGNLFNWSGLAPGSYRLQETTVPSGYKAIGVVDFTITAEHDTDGTITSLTATTKSTDVKGSAFTTDLDNNGVSATILEDTVGVTLPTTGAVGIVVICIVAGGLLALSFGLRAKRNENK